VRIKHTHPACPPLFQGCSLAYAHMFGQVESLKERQIRDLETHSSNSVNFHLSIRDTNMAPTPKDEHEADLELVSAKFRTSAIATGRYFSSNHSARSPNLTPSQTTIALTSLSLRRMILAN
jgi:hypothetical protein